MDVHQTERCPLSSVNRPVFTDARSPQRKNQENGATSFPFFESSAWTPSPEGIYVHLRELGLNSDQSRITKEELLAPSSDQLESELITQAENDLSIINRIKLVEE
ncbi:MAG: hypothetical protein HQM10_22190 [Candidatus Riflebacteria bacterium]|nr:hypothetical protein [Candidatus Riflebacteria bacterium]